MSAALKIFIIYAREDKVYKDDLLKSLKLLQNQGLIEPWHDSDIKPGDEWDKEIKAHLRAADIILPIISFDFFNSDYIHRVEIVEAFERYDLGDVVIVPIIADSCPWWDYLRLKDLQALPAGAKAIDDWADRKKAMASIYEGVKGLIVENRKKAELAAALKTYDHSWEGQIKYYSKLIVIDPENAFAFYSRGVAKKWLGQYTEAINDFDWSIKLNWDIISSLVHRAEAKCNMSRFYESIEDCDKALELMPNDSKAHFIRGTAKEKLGLFEEALNDYQESVNIDPQNGLAGLSLSAIRHKVLMQRRDIEVQNLKAKME